MPLSLRSIAGVPSSQALPGYLITAHHLCAFLLYLARWLCGGINKTKKIISESVENYQWYNMLLNFVL